MQEISQPNFSKSLELFILQPTSFCNINCDYCYLQDRDKLNIMSDAIIESSFLKLFETDIAPDCFTVVWHSGEPLSVKKSFYSNAFKLIENINKNRYQITHNIQTNAIPIDDEWCDIFISNNVKIGVSIDGPQFIHDKHRKTKLGKGTFELVLKGIETLKRRNIDFHVISVITEDTLPYPKEFYSFFKGIGVKRLGLNIEELEGVNKFTTFSSKNNHKIKFFISELFSIWDNDDNPINIREFNGIRNGLDNWDMLKNIKSDSQESTPFKIITIDTQGNFATFSPELISFSTNYGKFNFGNVLHNSFFDMLENDTFKKVYKDIISGNQECLTNCKYFPICRGGAPSNKYFESSTFNISESQTCINNKQAYIESIIEYYESKILQQ